MLFSKRKLDPIIKLKLKQKVDKVIPIIILLREPSSNRLKNSISKNNGRLKYEYKYMNAVAAQLTPDQIDRLSELPEVISISYDRKASICMDMTAGCIGIDHSSLYNLTGRNVTVAIIDTGVYLHNDLLRPTRAITYFKDYINLYSEPYDDNGHGTFICGVIAGSGNMSEGRYGGIAPHCKIIMLKTFNSVGEGAFSDILAAIGWVVENKEKYNIKILCLPFGADSIVPHTMDPLCKACEAASDSEIIVVTASGNKGPDQGTITTPGIDPAIITVGCLECRDSNIKSWNIPDFSGRGSRRENQIKPDFIAPGCGIVSLACDKSFISSERAAAKPLTSPYCSMTGSSVSAAVAAGCIALFLEKSPTISVKDIKGVLKLSCQTLNEVKNAQGYGVINLKKLLE